MLHPAIGTLMSKMNYTDRLVMIEPVAFRYNEQTATNNYYQKVLSGLDNERAQAKASKEFNDFVSALEDKGVTVCVVKDTLDPDTPDSIFPNNWISFHEDGTVGLYPMYAPNRRSERRLDVLDLLKYRGAQIHQVVDFTDSEEEGFYLEGTGSIVLDRTERVAYAALSERTDSGLFIEFCKQFDYTPVTFTAYQDVGTERKPIYHTNVMMAIAQTFAIICLDCIDDMDERHEVIEMLEEGQKDIIEITEEQVQHFAGNMLQVGKEGKPFLVMSEAAYKSLESDQIEAIEAHCPILHSSLDTIEACGGGSARCMIAEDFLPYAKLKA